MRTRGFGLWSMSFFLSEKYAKIRMKWLERKV